jgi:hypothetical protein
MSDRLSSVEVAQCGVAIIGATLGPDPIADVRVLVEDLSARDCRVLIPAWLRPWLGSWHAMTALAPSVRRSRS